MWPGSIYPEFIKYGTVELFNNLTTLFQKIVNGGNTHEMNEKQHICHQYLKRATEKKMW